MIVVNENRIKALDAPVCLLGESPMWHPGRGSAFWVDILGNIIIEYGLDSGIAVQYAGSRMISMLCPAIDVDDLLIVGAQGGVGTFNLESQHLSLISDLGKDWSGLRCNDGAVDCTGSLWIGTTHMGHEPEAGDLYRVSGAWCAVKKIERMSIPNGVCWSADNTIMYHTDSPTREIKAFNYDTNGNIRSGRVAVKVPASMGVPDGIAMDVTGTLWVALWGGGGVGGFNPHTGELEHWIPIPAPQVSSCGFIGRKLDRLLVTTARKEMDNEQLAEYPQSGQTFLVEMEAPGLPTYACQLPII